MADPWQEAYDFAVEVARKAGAVRAGFLFSPNEFLKTSLFQTGDLKLVSMLMLFRRSGKPAKAKSGS